MGGSNFKLKLSIMSILICRILNQSQPLIFTLNLDSSNLAWSLTVQRLMWSYVVAEDFQSRKDSRAGLSRVRITFSLAKFSVDAFHFAIANLTS